MSVFFDVIAALLAYIYSLWNNYAWAISGLTMLIMLALTPLTLKGTRSMMVMQQLQPEMKKIQTRYKDDRQKLNEELLKFYKENDINPLGGCLPLLVQMPVFIVFYAVLRGLTRRTSPTGFNFGFTGGQLGKAVTLVPPPTPVIPASGTHCATPTATPGACFDPSYLKHQTDLYQSLSHSTTMNALGMNLAESASKAVGSGAYHAAPYVILIAIVGVTGWVQQKQIQGRTPNAQVPQQQQAVMKIMPFFLPIISIGLPAGLVLCSRCRTPTVWPSSGSSGAALTARPRPRRTSMRSRPTARRREARPPAPAPGPRPRLAAQSPSRVGSPRPWARRRPRRTRPRPTRPRRTWPKTTTPRRTARAARPRTPADRGDQARRQVDEPVH